MKLFTKIDYTQEIQLHGKTYPIAVCGTGHPILAIGIGTPYQRTLSERFKKSFKVYSSDLYWVASHTPARTASATMTTIVDDIAAMADELRLDKFFIFGHSAYGIVALEVAKKYPDRILGLIIPGTPPNANTTVAAINEAYFNTHAEPFRKKIDAERRARFNQEDLTPLTTSALFLKTYIERDAARYWHDPSFNCAPVWEDIEISPLIDDLFTTILPHTDVLEKLETVRCPIFLAAGMSDYDCCPFLWAKIPNLPPHMVISIFHASGHWPHYEEAELFDARIEKWLETIADTAAR